MTAPRTLAAGLISVAVLVLPSHAYGDTQTSLGARTGEGSTSFTSLTQSPEANLFTGASSITIPIALPSGRKNMTPKLALTYSSSNSASPYGFGWDLAIGRIERSTRWGTPRCTGPHTNDFVLVLPSGAIELVNDPPGSDTYLPRYQEGYVKVRKIVASNEWEATDRSGIRYRFGTVPAARIGTDDSTFLAQDPDGYCRLTTVWALTNTEDPHGNSVDVSWSKILNVIYPISVDYGGNDAQNLDHFYHVNFTWQGRPDVIQSSHNGVPADMVGRLISISVTTDHPPAGASGVIRTYSLTHDADSPDATRSRLSRVLVTGDEWPQTFTYSRSDAGYDAATAITVPSAMPVLRQTTSGGEVTSTIMDMTGDGLLDLVTASASSWDVYPGKKVAAGGGFETTPVQWSKPGVGLAGKIRAAAENGCPGADSCVYQDTFDITGDGIPDWIDANPDPVGCPAASGCTGTNCNWWIVYKGVFAGNWGAFDPTPIRWPSPYRYLRLDQRSGDPLDTLAIDTFQDVVDVNGDGLPDLVRSGGETATRPYDPPYAWEVYLNTGSGFEADTSQPCALADFQPLPYFAAPSPWIERGGRFRAHDGGITEQLIDFNGDGLVDFLMIGLHESPSRCPVAGSTVEPLCLDVHANTGQGFNMTPRTSPLRFRYGPCSGGLRDWVNDQTLCDLLDINGDGLPDNVGVATGQPGEPWMVQLNRGGQLDPRSDVTYIPPPWPNAADALYGAIRRSGPIDSEGTTYTTADMLDVDGDGMLDRVDTQGGWEVQYNRNGVRPTS